MEPQLEPPEICECSGEVFVDAYLTIIDGEEFYETIVNCSECGEEIK